MFTFRRAFLFLGAFAVVGTFQVHCAAVHSQPDGYLARCAALFRGNKCQLEKTRPACLNRVFSGTWLTLHAGGTSGVDGTNRAASSDPWLRGFGYEHRNEMRELLRGLPFADAFNLTAPFNSRRGSTLQSCALVGSGSELLGTGLGSVINKHDVIVRLNRAPVNGFERDVGSFTTLRYTNNFNEGFREFDGEAVVASKWCASGPPCDFNETLRRLGRKKVHALNPAFVAYARRDTFAADVSHNPSSGFTATLLLLHVCNSVDVYGFSVFRDDPRMKQWYYNHEHRPAPHHEVFSATGSRLYPRKSQRLQQDAKFSPEHVRIPRGKMTTAVEAEAVETPSYVWPKYDELSWSINRWPYVLPNSAVRGVPEARQGSVAELHSKSSSSPPIKRTRVRPGRSVLAQSVSISREKKCLQALHVYGLITATDG